MLYIEAESKPKILYITEGYNLTKERRLEHFYIIHYFSIFFYPLAILILIGGVHGLLNDLNNNNIIGGINYIIGGVILGIVCFLSLLALLVNFIFKKYKKYDYSLYILYVNWYWHFVDIICNLLLVIYCIESF